MNKRKLAIGLLCAAIATVGAAAIAGCGDNPTGEHEHTFATDWSKDDANHWHAATCEHEEEKSDLAAHAYTSFTDNGDGTCSATCVCGATKTNVHDVAGYHYTAEGHIAACSLCGHYDSAAALTVHTLSTEWADEDGDGTYTKGCVCGYGREEHTVSDHVYTKEVKQRYLVTYEDGTGAEIGREITAQMCKDDQLKHVQICYICGHVNGEASEHNYAYADNYSYAHLKYCLDCEFYDNNDGNYEDDGKGDGYAHDTSESEVICVNEASAFGERGYHYITCKYCNAEMATAHTFDSNLTRISNNDGTHTVKCSGCDYNVTEDCTKAANGYETWLHNADEHWTYCVWCQGKLPATATTHTGSNWTESNGTYSGTCSVCGEALTHTTHEWAQGWACGETDDTKHYHYCSVCHTLNEAGESAAHSYTYGKCVCGAYDSSVAKSTGNTASPVDVTSRTQNNSCHFIATSPDNVGYYKFVAAQDSWITVAVTQLSTAMAGIPAIFYNVVPDTTNANGNYIYQSGRSIIPAGLYSCTYTENTAKSGTLSKVKWNSELETVYVIIDVEAGKQLTGTTTLTAAVPTTTLTISTAAATIAFAEGTVTDDISDNTPTADITLGQTYTGVTSTSKNYSGLKVVVATAGTYTFEIEGESARIAFQMVFVNGSADSSSKGRYCVYKNGADNTNNAANVGHDVTVTFDGEVTYTAAGSTKTNHRIVTLTLEAGDAVYFRIVNATADGSALSKDANAFTFKATKA